MKCLILHENKGRIRVRLCVGKMSLRQADILEYYLRNMPGITGVTVYDRTGEAVVLYKCSRDTVIQALSAFHYESNAQLVPENTSRELSREYENKLVFNVVARYAKKWFLPAPVRHILAVIRSVKFLSQGLKLLLSGRIEVPVLDAAAIGFSLLRGDYETASSVMFLLHIGEILEDWSYKKSVADLAGSMSLNIDQVWLRMGDEEILTKASHIQVGQQIVVRTGSIIPFDGRVAEGEATVNQASMTGESLPVPKTLGSMVYAGTVVEEGEIAVLVEKASGSGRYDRIVNMIEESEKLKSGVEDKAFHLADQLVPYSFLGMGLTYLLTQNIDRALSFLMVDFSCALKLAMPVAVLSAMKECSAAQISVKGGKFLEAVAAADTIVFDKTGTLTSAAPRVAAVVPFGRRKAEEMLRLAACLEEHYPHSIANAVVQEAQRCGLDHSEFHTEVKYIVAHGIASSVDGKKCIIGSRHFVFEDENCVIQEEDRAVFDALPDLYSHLYLAIDGELSAVICIEDPIRPEAIETIRKLHMLGISRVVMMTGDSRHSAKAVAERTGVDEFYAEVLPEDKAAFVRREKETGHTVIMIGDGVNDSPALSEANAGISIGSGAAIAKEIADIVITGGDLEALTKLRQLSTALMNRIDQNYRFIMGFNFSLIALGVLGIFPPASSALAHNLSTLAIGLHSMTPLQMEQ